MNLITELKIPRQTLLLMAIYLTIVLIFILAGIFPLHRAIGKIDQEIKRIAAKLDEQRDFTPLYRTFLERVNQEGKPVDVELTIPQAASLSRDQIYRINTDLQNISRNTGMNTLLLNPQLIPVEGEKFITVDHVLNGPFLSLRKYLVNIIKLPYFNKIEALKIQETASGLEFTVKFTVRVM